MYYPIILGLTWLIRVISIQAEVQDDILNYHNQYRQRHGADDLELNNDLSAGAQEYAEYLADIGQLEHSNGGGQYGENLFYSMGSDDAPRQGIDSWYNEKDNYYPGGGFSMDTGHFTQLVWKSSRELGVGVANRDDTTYIVCRYSPPGNYDGQFDDNVQL